MQQRKYNFKGVRANRGGVFSCCVFTRLESDTTTVACIEEDILKRYKPHNNKYSERLDRLLCTKVVRGGLVNTFPTNFSPYGERVFVKTVKRVIGDAEILSLASVNHVERIKRLPPFSTKLLGYSFDGDMVNIVMENAGVSFEDWLWPNNGPHSRPDMLSVTAGAGRRLLDEDPAQFQRVMDGVWTQMVLALVGYQKYIGLTHGDLHTSNVFLQDRRGTGVMNVQTEDGLIYCFDDDIPLLKIIDFGDSVVRSSTSAEDAGKPYAPTNSPNNCFDLFRFATGLAVRRAHYVAVWEFCSAELRQHLQRVLRPRTNTAPSDWFNWVPLRERPDVHREMPNSNAVHFPHLFDFPTPSEFLHDVSRPTPLARFASTRTRPAPPQNTFSELKNDGWIYDGSDAQRYFTWRENEAELVSKTLLYQPSTGYQHLDFARGLIVQVVVRQVSNRWKKRMLTPYDKRITNDTLLFYGRCHATVQSRVARRVLVCFQKGMRFYYNYFGNHICQGNDTVCQDNIVACLLAACGGYCLFFFGRSGVRVTAKAKQVYHLLRQSYKETETVPAELITSPEDRDYNDLLGLLEVSTNRLLYCMNAGQAMSAMGV